MIVAGSTLTLKIRDIAYRGRGVGTADGQVVFVGGVAPGETVRVRVTRVRRNFAEAVLLEVIAPSPMRIRPACPLATAALAGAASSPPPLFCPGCAYQHLRYDEELRLKQAQFRDLLRRLGGVETAGILDPVPSPEPLGYRNKIVLHAGRTGERDVLGYLGEDNVTVVDVPSCPLAVAPIDALLRRIREEDGWKAHAAEGVRLTLRWTQRDGAASWYGAAGREAGPLTEAVEPPGEFKVPRSGFAQVNTAVAGKLVSRVMDLLRLHPPSVFVDLYCGSGLLALAAAACGVGRIVGVDSDKAAIQAARQNAADRGLAGVEFVSAPAGSGLRRIAARADLAASTVLVDPPRRGLDPETLEALARVKPLRILYVSCAADTLSRDVRLLAEAGYAMTETGLLDMFPRTPYFESLTYLERADNS